MIELTAEARQRFDDYLARMRSALRGTRAVEAEEVEQNVREHVELALADAKGPVGPQQLAEVLDQLGAPERWLPEEDRPLWRRMAAHIWDGPEDWRLAYLTFGVMSIGFLFFPFGGVFLLVPAFVLARATVELVQERGETLGARRWLVLPIIWIFCLSIVLPALIGPVIGGSVFLIAEGGLRELGVNFPRHDSYEQGRLAFGAIATAAGAWWLILAGIFAIVMKPFRALFYPVTRNVGARHAVILAVVGLIVGAIGAAVLFS